MSSDASGISIRNAEPRDYSRVVEVMDDWWSGRIMSTRLSRVFLEHFTPTSFVAERGGELAGFLTGFLSQTYDGEAYVHFVGVRPDLRRAGLGATLYQRFFAVAHANGCTMVRSSTSPANRTSIAFHLGMGFLVEPGDGEVDGVPVRCDYPLPGESRVLFVRRLVSRHVVSDDATLRALLAG